MPQQPQKPPRGHALMIARKLANLIERENRRHHGRLTVMHLLRALEWTRYTVTEAMVDATGKPTDLFVRRNDRGAPDALA